MKVTSGYLDAEYPKDFCVSNPVLIKAKGCAPYKTDLCSLSVELAESPACAGPSLFYPLLSFPFLHIPLFLFPYDTF